MPLATQTPLSRTLACPDRFDVGLTYGPLGRGPSSRVVGDSWWHAMNSPAGDVTVCVRADRAAGEVHVHAWGPGAEWVVDRAPDITGIHADAPIFAPTDEVVAPLHRRLRGLHIVRLSAPVDLAAFTIIEQRVTSLEARRTWRRLVWRHGHPAPGGYDGRVPPSGADLAALPDREWRRVDVEARRSGTVRALGRDATRVESAAALGAPALDARLRSIRGIGPWTAAIVAHYVAGDADAVPVGDWHLPGHVGFALAGEARADDARMLELLEPFRPHRAIAWRLIVAGAAGPPRRAPRARILGLMQLEAARRPY